jgi:hypothetical protein
MRVAALYDIHGNLPAHDALLAEVGDVDAIVVGGDPDEVVAAMLAGVPESTIVCGHTHLQLDRRIGGKRVVNAGSVGFPHDRVGAHWALLGPDVELRPTDYERAAAYERFVHSDWYEPGRPAFLVESMRSSVSRNEMLDFFDKLAARQRGA